MDIDQAGPELKLIFCISPRIIVDGPLQSAENRRKERHAVILISNFRTSASKKINRMALIRTLTVSTTGFRQTV